jgi:hypothetical protein
MAAATMRRIEMLLRDRRRTWAAGGNRDERERLERELAELYAARRSEQVGRAGQPYSGKTTRWPR